MVITDLCPSCKQTQMSTRLLDANSSNYNHLTYHGNSIGEMPVPEAWLALVQKQKARHTHKHIHSFLYHLNVMHCCGNINENSFAWQIIKNSAYICHGDLSLNHQRRHLHKQSNPFTNALFTCHKTDEEKCWLCLLALTHQLQARLRLGQTDILE